MKFLLLLTCCAVLSPAQQVDEKSGKADAHKLKKLLEANEKILRDWPNLARYYTVNHKLGAPADNEDRVVFMGDSITDAWGRKFEKFFPGKPYVGRGIGGQTTPQMLVRFRQDVIELEPKVVVILAGTNDIAGNTGPTLLTTIEGNLQSMAELARVHGIKVVLSAIMPVSDYHRPQTDRRPPEKIIEVNEWIKSYCERTGAVYLDYWTAMIDEEKMLRQEWTADGLHPNDAGYEAISPLAEKAIQQALGKIP